MAGRQLTAGTGWRGAVAGLLLAVPMVAACQSSAGSSSLAGNYLIGREALGREDYDTAAEAFTNALGQRPDDAVLYEQAVFALVAAGRADDAFRIARSVEGEDLDALVALVRYVEAMQRGDFEAARIESSSLGDLLGLTTRGWALAGKGEVDSAIAGLVAFADQHGGGNQYRRAFVANARFHAWLIALADGRDAKPYAAFADAPGNRLYAARMALIRGARAAGTEAQQHFLDGIRIAPANPWLREAFLEGEFAATNKYRQLDPITGAHEALLLSGVHRLARFPGIRRGDLVLLRLAEHLSPADPETQLALRRSLLGENLLRWAEENLGSDVPVGLQLEVAGAFVDAGEEDRGLALFDGIAADWPADPWVQEMRGSTYRIAARYEQCIESFDVAIDRVERAIAETQAPDGSGQQRAFEALSETSLVGAERRAFERALADRAAYESLLWNLHFQWAICHERAGDWPSAEQGLQRALRLRPNDPTIVNYLAYSWVDRGENLEVSLAMLEAASAARPNDGNILDSVGWARYRLGDFEGALRDLEQAVEMQPNAPEIYDHIGDALWQLGNRTEAEYQWRRVLTLEPGEKLRASAERKIQDGLAGVEN